MHLRNPQSIRSEDKTRGAVEAWSLGIALKTRIDIILAKNKGKNYGTID
jgi:hypothetical protein